MHPQSLYKCPWFCVVWTSFCNLCHLNPYILGIWYIPSIQCICMHVSIYFPLYLRYLVPPQIIQMDHPLSSDAKFTVAKARRQATRILNNEDDRLLIIIGPCSIHDVDAALDYGKFIYLNISNLRLPLSLLLSVTYFFSFFSTSISSSIIYRKKT